MPADDSDTSGGDDQGAGDQESNDQGGADQENDIQASNDQEQSTADEGASSVNSSGETTTTTSSSDGAASSTTNDSSNNNARLAHTGTATSGRTADTQTFGAPPRSGADAGNSCDTPYGCGTVGGNQQSHQGQRNAPPETHGMEPPDILNTIKNAPGPATATDLPDLRNSIPELACQLANGCTPDKSKMYQRGSEPEEPPPGPCVPPKNDPNWQPPDQCFGKLGGGQSSSQP
ncbi:hypothetical protein IPZ69_19075 [Streptomyces olivochromogenes]|nr:hypothetical protein [Streptomyces olivochromogenes]